MSRDPRTAQQADLFRGSFAPTEETHAPFQPKSPASQDAAKRMTEGPAFAGNRLACLKEIARAHNHGGTTRKMIAEKYFAGKQNYVTGPVAVLIEEGLVYEDAARDRHGAIMKRDDQTIIPRRIDHSAVLLLTNKGKAVSGMAA